MDISSYFLEEDSINNTVNVPLLLPLHINGMQNLSDCSYPCALDLSDLSEIDMNTLTNDTWMGYNAPSLKTVDQEILTTPQLTPGSCISTTQPTLDEFEEFLAPLLSPAIAPSFTETFELNNATNDLDFSSLSSPALALGSKSEDSNVLCSSLVLDEPNISSWNDQMVVSPLTMLCRTTPRQPTAPRKLSLRQQAVFQNHDPNLPVTPASLMNIDTKPLVPRTTMKTKSIRKKSKVSPPKIVPLKPLLSPYPQPTIHHASPMPQNNQNNNTRYLHENKQIPSFLSGIEGRRSAHKMAEQRRRDVLKQSFDSLRSEITDVMVTDCINESCSQESIREEKEKEVQNMSKVLLLQYSYEYIVRLKRDAHQKDQKLEKMQLEIKKLRSKVAS